MFAATAGRNVRTAAVPAGGGRLACAGPVRAVCVVHGVGVGAGVAAATVGATVVALGALAVLHPTAMSVTANGARMR